VSGNGERGGAKEEKRKPSLSRKRTAPGVRSESSVEGEVSYLQGVAGGTLPEPDSDVFRRQELTMGRWGFAKRKVRAVLHGTFSTKAGWRGPKGRAGGK